MIGIFLTKSLIGYKLCGETIETAIRKRHIYVKPPVYFTPLTKLQAVANAFKTGESHMGVVCENKDIGVYMSDQAGRILQDIINGDYEYYKLDEHEIKGILTLENVIEFVLKMDIKDEKDRDHEITESNKKPLQRQLTVGDEPSQKLLKK